jgi:hypothetical protein
MAQQNRSRKPEPLDESNDIACVILVPIPVERCARIPVPSGVWHHDVVFAFESACQRNPAGPVPCQSMEQNQRGLVPTGSQIVDVNAICFADSAHPVCHWEHPFERWRGSPCGGSPSDSVSQRRAHTAGVYAWAMEGPNVPDLRCSFCGGRNERSEVIASALHLRTKSYICRGCVDRFIETMPQQPDSPAVIDICSFCGEPGEIPKRFLRPDGDPEGAAICDMCVAVCRSIIEDNEGNGDSGWTFYPL